MSIAALDRSLLAAGSTRRCWPRSAHRVPRVRLGSSGSPKRGSPAPVARSTHGPQRPSRACQAADEDASNAARAATGASDGSSPAARTHCPTSHEEAAGRVPPDTADQLSGPRPTHLPTEHRAFVTQDEYLHLVRGV